MIQLSNKREIYNVSNETSDLKLVGDVTFDATKRITNFNGQFFTLDDNYAGNFSYFEMEGDFSQSVSSIPNGIDGKAVALLDTTVVELKNV